MNRGRGFYMAVTLRGDHATSRSEACQLIKIEMVGDRVEERGDAKGDEAEPCGLAEVSQLSRIAAASDTVSRSRGGRETGREESEKEAETGKPEVYSVLEIDIVDHGPGLPDLLI